MIKKMVRMWRMCDWIIQLKKVFQTDLFWNYYYFFVKSFFYSPATGRIPFVDNSIVRIMNIINLKKQQYLEIGQAIQFGTNPDPEKREKITNLESSSSIARMILHQFQSTTNRKLLKINLLGSIKRLNKPNLLSHFQHSQVRMILK